MVNKRYLYLCIFLFVCAVFGILFWSYKRIHKSPDIIEKIDTVFVEKLVKVTEPEYVYKIRVDTIIVPKTEYVFITDTVYIDSEFITNTELIIPREQAYYKGDNYEAWVSGYRPMLDSLSIKEKTVFVTKQVKRTKSTKRFGIGPQVGFGLVLNDKIQPITYLGIGVHWDIISF